MTAELGGTQLSSLLESVPGLASVLRSPVADAIVNMIRAGAGLGDFRPQDAKELVQYATRRGLIPSTEGAELLVEVEAVAKRRHPRAKSGRGDKTRTSKAKGSKKKALKASTPAKKAAKKKATKSAKSAKKATKRTTKAVKKKR
ncbi:MAG: hypothetical protein P8X82_00260 [Gemmatimonadales bacterium]